MLTAAAVIGTLLASTTAVVLGAIGNDLPGMGAAGVSSAFLSALWWQERKDRRQAEERERAILERALVSIEQVSKAAELMEAFSRGSAR